MSSRLAILEGFNGPGGLGAYKKKRRKSKSKRKGHAKKSTHTRAKVRSAFRSAVITCRKEAPGKGRFGTCMRSEIKKNLRG